MDLKLSIAINTKESKQEENDDIYGGRERLFQTVVSKLDISNLVISKLGISNLVISKLDIQHARVHTHARQGQKTLSVRRMSCDVSSVNLTSCTLNLKLLKPGVLQLAIQHHFHQRYVHTTCKINNK
jgi:hypothetical protein